VLLALYIFYRVFSSFYFIYIIFYLPCDT